MKNYIAIDSGGTKVIAILYDEHFHPIAISRVGSFRSNTTPADQIQRNMVQLVKDLDLSPGSIIHQISGITTDEFIAFLGKIYPIVKVDLIDELSAGLCAAEIFGDGIQTLSGTGSNSAARYQGNNYFVGGYGSSISDIGSGYWLGREALNAAIADFEGYGPHTSLTDLLSSHFGGNRNSFRDAIFSIYENDMESISAQIAYCSRIVSRAAEAGDQIALDILKNAGKLLATQTVSMIKKHQLPDALPQTISGNAWRSHPAFLSSFIKSMWEYNEQYPLKLPVFEPVVGVIIRHYYETTGRFSKSNREYFRALYPQFALHFPVITELVNKNIK